MVTVANMPGETHHVKLQRPEDLDAWEPRDGHAIVTCKVRVQSGAYDAWEPRTYEFEAGPGGGWVVYPGGGPGGILRDSWQHVVNWFCCMRPIEIELVTTV